MELSEKEIVTYKEWEDEIIQYAENHVDFVGPSGDCSYVPIENNALSRIVTFLEYGKRNTNPKILIQNAKDWFFAYSKVMRETFSGNVDKPHKTKLYWRWKPEFKRNPEDGAFILYFRVYID